MVLFKCLAEIRSSFVCEEIKYPARTVNGQMMPEKQWKKMYYHAEINDVPCVLRFHEKEGVVIPSDFHKGQQVEVSFSAVSVESDVSQVSVVDVHLAKGVK